MIFDGCQNHSMGMGQSLQQIMLGKLDLHVQKKKTKHNPKLDPYFIPYTKIN